MLLEVEMPIEIPVKSFSNVVDMLVDFANGKIPDSDPRLPRIREVKKAIPIRMSDFERKFDPEENKSILNKILICRQIQFLIDEIIEERNLAFFAKQELAKRIMELAEYIRSRDGFDIPEEEQESMRVLLTKDPLLQEQLEKILALEKLIKELEEQNKILMEKYDEYVHVLAEELDVKLEKIEPYAKMSKEERIDLIEKALHATIAIEHKLIEKREKRPAREARKPAEDSVAPHPSLEGESSPVTPVIFSEPDDTKRRTAIRHNFMSMTKEKWDSQRIAYTPDHLTQTANVFCHEYEQRRQPLLAIKIQIFDNGVKIGIVQEEISDRKKEFKESVEKHGENMDIFNAVISRNEYTPKSKGP